MEKVILAAVMAASYDIDLMTLDRIEACTKGQGSLNIAVCCTANVMAEQAQQKLFQPRSGTTQPWPLSGQGKVSPSRGYQIRPLRGPIFTCGNILNDYLFVLSICSCIFHIFFI